MDVSNQPPETPLTDDAEERKSTRLVLRRRFQRLLSNLSSVPGSIEIAEQFFQRRLVLFAGLQAALWAATWGANWVLNVLFFPEFAAGAAASPRSGVHLGVAVLLFALTLTYRKARPIEVMVLGDVLSTLIPALGLSSMILWGDPKYRTELPMAMALVHILVLRAALIPSSIRRTLLLGVASELLLIGATALLYYGDQASPLSEPTSAPAQLVVWACVTLSITAAISRVIYRLRARVHAERFGQYTVTSKLGEGASGVVYLADHSFLRRPTAVKLLKQTNPSTRSVGRFAREAQELSRLSHPNIVGIYDYGQTPSGQLYYAMEYLNGVDLEKLVRKTGKQSEGRVVDLLRQAAEALEEAHRAGVVHRDVKPSNLVICPRSRGTELVKLVDFGLAKELPTATGDAMLSDATTLVGTPLYMAPEAIRSAEGMGPKSDIYALGAVGYFLLAGEPPFSADSAVEVLFQHLYAPVPPAASASKSLQELLKQCLSKKPAERPSAGELVSALENLGPPWTATQCRAWWEEHAATLLVSPKYDASLKTRVFLDEGFTPERN